MNTQGRAEQSLSCILEEQEQELGVHLGVAILTIGRALLGVAGLVLGSLALAVAATVLGPGAVTVPV